MTRGSPVNPDMKEIQKFMRGFYALLLICILSACIEVKDTGEYWAKGTIDPALEGQWTVQSKDGPGHLVFTKDGPQYHLFTAAPKEPDKEEGLLRTIEYGGHKFALLVDPKNTAYGKLWPYEVKDGTLNVFGIDATETKEVNAMTDADIQNKEHPSAPMIEKLDERSLQALVKIYETSPNWAPGFSAIKVK